MLACCCSRATPRAFVNELKVLPSALYGKMDVDPMLTLNCCAGQCRQSQGNSAVRAAFLSKQKESCKDHACVTARHSSLGLPLSTANIYPLRSTALPGIDGSTPARSDRKGVRSSQAQPLVAAATNRCATNPRHVVPSILHMWTFAPSRCDQVAQAPIMTSSGVGQASENSGVSTCIKQQ